MAVPSYLYNNSRSDMSELEVLKNMPFKSPYDTDMERFGASAQGTLQDLGQLDKSALHVAKMSADTNGETLPANGENSPAGGLQSPSKSMYKGPNGWSNGFLSAADSFLQSDTATSNRNTVSEWGAGGSSVEGSSGLTGLSSAWGASPLGTAGGGPGSTTMSDITNKQHPQPNQAVPSNSVSSGVNSVPNGASSVWQNNEPGDNGKNSWNSASGAVVGSGAAAGAVNSSSQSLSIKNSTSAAASGPFGTPGNPNGPQGQDKENAASITLPQTAERTPLDNMIYRDGWGQVEIKQEPPWPIPESPPIQDDPSVWKPKTNTGTEVWEKSTGHRTQPWQNQGPNTPHWMSDDREPNSVWSGVPPNAQMSGPMSGGPRSAGMMGMPGSLGGNGGGNGGGDGMLNNGGMSAHDRGQSGRPSWNSPGGTGSGGSGASSGGNISPTNQWSDHTNWSDWRDPSSRKSEVDDGTGHWNQPMGPRSSNGPYGGGGSGSMSLNDNRKMQQSEGGYQQQKPRGWSDSGFPGGGGGGSQMRGGSSEWNEDNEWRDPDNEKAQWSSGGGRERPHQPPSFSPPNGVTSYRNPPKYTRDQIYQSKQYQNLLEMGFKREEIDIAMRNSNMNYEATVTELQQQRRRQQMQQQQQLASSNSANFGMGGGDGYGKTGLTGTGSGGPGVPGSMQPHHQNNTLIQPPQPGKMGQSRPQANVQAVARQLSNAAQQGIINPRLLNQPLCPQTVYHLHKLMQLHRQMQQLTAQMDVVASQKAINPALQQQQMAYINQQGQMVRKEIVTVQKQIDLIQNEYLKSPMDPRFQGGPTIVDLATSMSGMSGLDFHSSSAAPNYGQSGWRMPEPNNPYASMGGGDGNSWGGGGSGSFAGAGAGSAFNNSNMAAAAGGAPMWNDPHNWNNAGMNQGGMNWRPTVPGGGAGGHNMDDWSGGMHGAGSMKMSSSGAGNTGGQHAQSASGDRGSLSPTSRTGATGNGAAGYGMDEADGSWGNRQIDSNSFANFTSRMTWDALPEFEPGKPWRGSQMISADEDPHLTPGSVAKSPLMNAVTSGGGGSHFNSSD
ncbi:protein Gawky-like isoform X2 [Paramacrobiotus metropolitanus]|uniref:protein Gawky-like isoform X2 n=1 Tax=Paramacrobiotus metropolitanus TaxID=2943436 RepID=UPI0024458B37|nr:protein Gawky-like isoform X2 [Paramacrobiotus metropolitanus]